MRLTANSALACEDTTIVKIKYMFFVADESKAFGVADLESTLVQGTYYSLGVSAISRPEALFLSSVDGSTIGTG